MEVKNKKNADIPGIEVIEKLIMEVADEKIKLPATIRQQIVQVVKIMTTEIVMLNMERDQRVVDKKYKEINAGLLKLKEKIVVLASKVNVARKQVLGSIDAELQEMLNLLEFTIKQCSSSSKG